jgi:FKBP-type peptidyl-prolyl cis-trans isomerase
MTAGSGAYATFFVQGWQSNGTEIQPRITMSNIRLGARELIPGVDEALIGMRVGGERLAVVPPDLAYGQGIVLVFKLELTSVSGTSTR